MNIVHGVLSLDVGGLERIVLALATGQAQAGHTVTILCIDSPGTFANDAIAAGIAVISLNKPPGRPTNFATTVEAALKPLRPQVLHTHQIGAAYHLAAVAKSLNARVIHTEHGNPFARASSFVSVAKLRMLMWMAARSIDRFCCVSEDSANSVIKYGTVSKSKVEIVPNGIAKPTNVPDNIRELLNIPASAKVVGTVGRLHEVKQQHILLKAIAKLPGVWALLVGDGPERAALETLANTLGIADRTVFVGYQAEPWGYLAAMDVFALTSRSEGFPVSLLEAWALAKPVVCSAVGGLKTIIQDKSNGLLVTSGNVEGFAKAIEVLFQDVYYAHDMAMNGASTFEKQYTFDVMRDRYQFLYSHVN